MCRKKQRFTSQHRHSKHLYNRNIYKTSIFLQILPEATLDTTLAKSSSESDIKRAAFFGRDFLAFGAGSGTISRSELSSCEDAALVLDMAVNIDGCLGSADRKGSKVIGDKD